VIPEPEEGMRRRDFITRIGGVAAALPFAARAQQSGMPVVGFLSNVSQDSTPGTVDAFRAGLTQAGYLPGRDVAIEFRWADGRYDRLTVLAADLIQRKVRVIVAAAVDAAHAAKAATTTIPIVFVISGDPVAEGLVGSLNWPGGNLTGVTTISGELSAKRLELLRVLVPGATEVGALINPANSNAAFRVKDLRDAAQVIGQEIHFFEASSESGLDAAFATMVRRHTTGLLIVDDPLFGSQMARLVALAAQHAVPTIHYRREFVLAGGLLSYAANYAERYREVAIYAARILRGEKPGDLPVQQPTKFELVINLKTAKALGLEVPPMLLARADEVIE
jgi:putative ABC transport system substrate-binding protein